MSAEEFGAKVYALRFLREAREAIDVAHSRIAAAQGADAADAWEEGLEETLSHLATGPYRAVAVESALFTSEVRSLTFRRGGQAHRVLYVIREETPDGPQVRILSLRPAAADPLKPHEARNLERSEQEWDEGG